VANRRAQLAESKETDERIQQQLIRITGGKTFKQVDRLKRLLNFVVLESLAGRGDQLKEYVIGVQVFEKDASFDPRTDPIVRVVARRLRTRLARYYQEEGASLFLDAFMTDSLSKLTAMIPDSGHLKLGEVKCDEAGIRKAIKKAAPLVRGCWKMYLAALPRGHDVCLCVQHHDSIAREHSKHEVFNRLKLWDSI
jgi:hypothetical protein